MTGLFVLVQKKWWCNDCQLADLGGSQVFAIWGKEQQTDMGMVVQVRLSAVH